MAELRSLSIQGDRYKELQPKFSHEYIKLGQPEPQKTTIIPPKIKKAQAALQNVLKKKRKVNISEDVDMQVRAQLKLPRARQCLRHLTRRFNHAKDVKRYSDSDLQAATLYHSHRSFHCISFASMPRAPLALLSSTFA